MTDVAVTSTSAGDELFIINLCASMTPMPEVPKHLKGFERYKLYQVSRIEDGRRRYRLRLGFFTNETDAELVLTSIRNLYPAAFSGCVGQEDQRFIDIYPSATTNRASSNQTSPAQQPPANAASNAAIPSHPVTVAATAKPAATPPPVKPLSPAALPRSTPTKQAAHISHAANLELTLADMPTVTAPTNSGESGVFHVGRGIELPDIQLELSPEPVPAAPKVELRSTTTTTAHAPPATAAKHSSATGKSATKPSTATAAATTPSSRVTAAPSKPILQATIDRPPANKHDYIPILDTTLTIRTLTKSEAEDPHCPKWFAIQLAVSEQPINLAALPQLDIFAAYRVYSVALMEQNSIRHALRLGFFKEASSAEAVNGYLKTFFDEPKVTQVSGAEHDRFAEGKKAAPKTEATVHKLEPSRATGGAGAAGNAAQAKPATPIKPRSATMPKAGPTAPRNQSFLSRLIGRQLD